jgi:GTP 3',8-cyclase
MACYVRLSLTAACDLRCRYCRVEAGPGVPPGPPLTVEETLALLLRIRRLAGLRKVRLTGGEPLTRPDVVEVTRRLRSALPEVELGLTTNGTRLAALAAPLRAAGLDRINVSLDTLSRRRFFALTGRDGLPDVLRGIRAAGAAGLAPLRLNAVLLRSASGQELSALVRFAARESAEIRFIELMPLGRPRP